MTIAARRPSARVIFVCHTIVERPRCSGVHPAEAAARSGDGGEFRAKWLANRERFVGRTNRWLRELSASGDIAPLDDTLAVAEGLSALTEQMAYVEVGLADEDPGAARLEQLGKACGLIWYRTLFGRVQ